MPNHITTALDNHILTIRINRPERKNALTLAMYTDITEAITNASNQSDVRVILITGTQDCFTSGNDLEDFLKAPPDLDSPVALFMQALHLCPLPVVAAVSGPAIGIGTTLLLHCDLAYAASNSQFQLPFANLGLCPEFASSLLLPQLMGRVKAAELLLLGNFFDAEKACEAGIINQVVDDNQLISTAMSSCNRLAQQPPSSLRATKSLMQNNQQERVSKAMREEFCLFLERLKSKEFNEAVTAFLEKRAADYSRFQ